MRKRIRLVMLDWDGVLCDSLPVYWALYQRHVSPAELNDFKSILDARAPNAKILPGKLSQYANDLAAAELFPGAVRILNMLSVSNAKCVIVSTSKRKIIESILLKSGLELTAFEIFDSEIGLQKPEKKLLHHILRRFDAKETEVIYVGDEKIDIDFISNTRINGILVSYGFCSESVLQEYASVVSLSFKMVSSIKSLEMDLLSGEYQYT